MSYLLYYSIFSANLYTLIKIFFYSVMFILKKKKIQASIFCMTCILVSLLAELIKQIAELLDVCAVAAPVSALLGIQSLLVKVLCLLELRLLVSGCRRRGSCTSVCAAA